MIINKNSLHCRIYKYFWVKNNDELPDNLCPYFWKMLIAMVFSLPVFILSLPIMGVIAVIDRGNLYDFKRKPQFERILVSFFILIILGFLHSMFLIPIAWLLDWIIYEGHYVVGSIGWSLIGFCLFMYLIFTIKDKLKERGCKEKEPSIVKEFIKAKYNKYCPKIDWK